MNRARERRRQLARLRNLIARHTSKPRGDYPGWPGDMEWVDGRSPEFPGLRGWALQCWQWHPHKTNRPHWLVDGVSCNLSKIPPGTWLLRRPGDGFTLWDKLTPEQYRRWKNWRPTHVKAV